jgi:hypothetical protein
MRPDWRHRPIIRLEEHEGRRQAGEADTFNAFDRKRGLSARTSHHVPKAFGRYFRGLWNRVVQINGNPGHRSHGQRAGDVQDGRLDSGGADVERQDEHEL